MFHQFLPDQKHVSTISPRPQTSFNNVSCFNKFSVIKNIFPQFLVANPRMTHHWWTLAPTTWFSMTHWLPNSVISPVRLSLENYISTWGIQEPLSSELRCFWWWTRNAIISMVPWGAIYKYIYIYIYICIYKSISILAQVSICYQVGLCLIAAQTFFDPLG